MQGWVSGCVWMHLCLYVCEWLMAEERGKGLLPGGLVGLLATVQWSLRLLSLTHITTSLTLNRPPIFRWPIAFGTVCAGAVWIITLLHNEDGTVMQRNTVSTNYKIKFVCLSLLSGWLMFSFFFFFWTLVHTAAQANPAVHVLSGKHREDKTAQEHYPMFK